MIFTHPEKLCLKAFGAIFMLLSSGFFNLVFAQGINTDFGQNRVQYHDFTWSYYQSDNFVTYFYIGGQDIGKFTVQIAEKDLAEIENILDYKINSRMEILVYNDVTDLNQSNIGIGLDLNNIGGVTKIIGNKIFIYYNGDHLDLRRQIREGISKVLISNMIFGGNFQEVLQNAVLLNLPEWFVDGLVSYVGLSWSPEHDNRLKDGILTGKYKRYNKLSGEDAKLAGHSFWYFIEERNGKEAIPNLLYLTRINRSLENAFLFVLGYSYNAAIDEWYNYFYERYTKEDENWEEIGEEEKLETKKYKNRTIYQAKISPNGKYMAFVTNDIGKWRLHLTDLTDNSTNVILKGGFKSRQLGIDYGYPLIDWNQTSRKIAVIYEKKDNIKLMQYNVDSKGKEYRDIVKFQRIVDFSFTNNPNKVIMSAINRGQSDIYSFDLRSKTYRQLTNDFYDDLSPVYVTLKNHSGIIFSSNRLHGNIEKRRIDTLLPVNNYDLYFLDEDGDPQNALNLTNTPYIDEFNTNQVNEKYFAYLSNMNGIYNRYYAYIDTVFSHWRHVVFYKDSTRVYQNANLSRLYEDYGDLIDSIDQRKIYKDTAYSFAVSNYGRGILEQDVQVGKNKSLDLVYNQSGYQFYLRRIQDTVIESSATELENTGFRKKEIKERKLSAIEFLEKERNVGTLFQSEFDENDSTFNYEFLDVDDHRNFLPTKVRPYRVKFSTDYVLSQLDNTIYVDPYQNFVGNGPVFQPPPLGGLISVSISDLLENYRFTGGFRFPFTFNGSEYFFQYENLKKRLDKSFLYYRKAEGNVYSFVPIWFQEVSGKQVTNYFESKFTYPLDILRSVRVKFAYKNYKINFQSRDTFSLNIPSYNENWLIGKLEYVFDNTYEVGLNILNGARYKIYYEIQQEFQLDLDPKIKFDPSLGTMHILGADVRHYLKIHRTIIWANRIAAATSFGTKKVIYYLGGVDNWLAPQFDPTIEVNMDNNYAFQTLATNLRGHKQNIRNGNSYVVLNSELRIPVFTYFFNTPIRSELIRNFQLIGFGDIGTAWEGLSPFSTDNPFNSETVEKGPVRITTQYFRNPIVGGFGVGARTVIFGYFLRIDAAWGVDSGVINKSPLWYFSLNLDF